MAAATGCMAGTGGGKQVPQSRLEYSSAYMMRSERSRMQAMKQPGSLLLQSIEQSPTTTANVQKESVWINAINIHPMHLKYTLSGMQI